MTLMLFDKTTTVHWHKMTHVLFYKTTTVHWHKMTHVLFYRTTMGAFVYSNHDHDLLLILNIIEKIVKTLYHDHVQFDHDHFYFIRRQQYTGIR
jgi:hypothetical protein